MRTLVVILLWVVLYTPKSDAATITAASASITDVTTAVASAVNGDTVVIPAGSAHWTTNLLISDGITLQGAGTNSTIIYDDIPNGSDAFGFAASVINVATVANKFYRVTGIQIATNTVRTASLGIAQITFSGDSKACRLDHCLFGATSNRLRAVSFYGATCGVVDHCSFFNTTRNFDVLHSTWGGQLYGDGSWSDNSSWGTTNTVVVEDCYMKGINSSQAFTDSFDGARYCVRYCTLEDGHLDAHEGGSRTRATRQVEIYMNTFIVNGGNGLVSSLRGGSTVVWSNTLVGSFDNLTVLYNYRSQVNYPTWGGVSGTNIWDNNAPSAAVTGTHTGTNGASTVMVDATKSWTVNQWLGYALQNTSPTATNSLGYGRLFGVVIANTATTLTTYTATFATDQIYWTNGNGYALYFVTNGFDMPGMGKDDGLSGDPPIPAGWPHQQLEPCYQWGNTPSNLNIIPNYAIMRENVHYYNGVARPGYVPLVYPHPLVSAPTINPIRFSVSGNASFFGVSFR